MSDFNSQHNRAVWFDIPVADLERAASFYRAVLAIQMHREQAQGSAFYVLEHAAGNGGGPVSTQSPISAGGVLGYLNGDRPVREAGGQAEVRGGQGLEHMRPHR